MSESLITSFLMSDVSESLRSLTKNERCEQIAQVAHQKWAICSGPLRGNERLWANRSGRSPKMSEWVNRSFFWVNRSFAHFWAKHERFARKTDERIPSPGYIEQWGVNQSQWTSLESSLKSRRHFVHLRRTLRILTGSQPVIAVG